MPSLVQDLRMALRSLAKAPILTVVGVLSLALGIGANTAIFTLFDQVLLRLLPVKDPRSLVMVATKGSHSGSNRGPNAISYPMYKDYRERNQVFDGILCRRGETVNAGFLGKTERAEAELASGNYFEVLGVGPALGRVLSPEDERAPGAEPVVVLSHDYWRNRFAGDRDILGKALLVNGHPMTIVGVAAPGFYGGEPRIPAGLLRAGHDEEAGNAVVGRPGGSPEPVGAGIRAALARARPGRPRRPLWARSTNRSSRTKSRSPTSRTSRPYWKEQFLKSHAVVLPGGQGYSNTREELTKPLRVLMILVGLVLLITCANVSNLLVAKATSRRKEIALRLALGARRAAIVKQLLVESLLLAFVGGTLGLLLAYWTTRGLILLAPTEQARLSLSATPDVRVLSFTLGLSALAAVIFGLLPALQAARDGFALDDEAGLGDQRRGACRGGSKDARRRAGRGRAPPAPRLGALRSELEEPEPGRSRIPSHEPRAIQDRPHARRLRRRGDETVLPAAPRSTRAPFPESSPPDSPSSPSWRGTNGTRR